MNTIDISTEEKRNEVYELFASFKKKGDIHAYFSISDNSDGCEYIREVAEEIGFDLNSYKKKKQPRYCKNCGKEITSKTAEKFCSSSCAATYHNLRRDKSVYDKLSETLKEKYTRKESEKKTQKKVVNKKSVKETQLTKKCPVCGVEIKNKLSYCSDKCACKQRHLDAYKDFIENNEKYCRGNYTPKAFKNFFLEEQNGVCDICGCEPTHNGKPLVFVIDHIDGDASNNKRENLRMICPNCDSQLDTFKSKNKNSKRRNYWKEHIIKTLKDE